MPPLNTKYSGKNWNNQTFLDIDPDEFSNTVIKGASFYQESAYSEDASHNDSGNHRDTSVNVFPSGTHGVMFDNCFLDNVKIPGPPTTVLPSCWHRKIRVMNDGEDWILDDANHKPVGPVNPKKYVLRGLSIDPADIPTVKAEMPITGRTPKL